VETTTGPLGQGITNAVGMALAEKLLAHEFNRPGHTVVDHRTYAFLGDGCLMEGISHEACALAGAWKLNKLVALYDDNGISIDGDVRGWFADDTPGRFRACGWQVIGPIDGHDLLAVDAAITQAEAQARRSDARPTLIVCRTTIGKGAIGHEGTADVHGAPLGASGIAAMRQHLGWTAAPFEVPDELRAAWDGREVGAVRQQAWDALFARYAQAHPALAAEFRRRMAGQLPADWAQRSDAAVVALAEAAASAGSKPVATRRASQLALDALAPLLPEIVGGSADLTGSNLTDFAGHRKAGPGVAGGNYLSYGVREFGMAAVMNGMALHQGLIPFGGTFLTFSDYSRNAIRMAALMKQRVIHVFTHDSIGLGEDGPTHQSIEHVASLRLIPGLDVWRPADTTETVVAWTMAIGNAQRPSVLALSRQNLPYAPKTAVDDIAKGAYVLSEPSDAGLKKKAKGVIIATGSEVQLALAAQATLAQQGIPVRVVSMPSTTVFDRQDLAYKKAVLPEGLPRVAVEMGVSDGWWKYGVAAVVGIDSYGESAPAPVLFKHFGFTAENVVDTVKVALGVAKLKGGKKR
ncbi:MAG: transketolase, partial [Burkholderiales bacterium PBB2]